MCWRGIWADRGCLSQPASRTQHGDDAHSTIDDGNVALVHCTCLGKVDGLTESAFGPRRRVMGVQMTDDAHGTIDNENIALVQLTQKGSLSLLVDDTHGTIDDGNVALVHCA